MYKQIFKIFKRGITLYKPDNIDAPFKHYVWNTYIGDKLDGKCSSCIKKIYVSDFKLSKNNKDSYVDTVFPICNDCYDSNIIVKGY